jgi:hypothetical protein
MTMGIPQGEKGSLAGMVGTGNAVKIDLNFPRRTEVGDGPWKTVGPFPYKLTLQNDFHSVTEEEDGGSQHNLIGMHVPCRAYEFTKLCISIGLWWIQGSGTELNCPRAGNLPNIGQRLLRQRSSGGVD